MGLFGKRKRSSQVGPILSSFYDHMDPGYRADFVRFISGAPSGGELLGTLSGASVEQLTEIVTAFQKEGLPGHGVIGAQEAGDGRFAIYIKGDFSESALEELAAAFREAGRRFGFGVTVELGCFGADQLKDIA